MGGCVAATRTTKRHFELFKSECLRLLEEWGVLSEWRVEFVHEKLVDSRAQIRTVLLGRACVLALSTEWEEPGDAPQMTDQSIRDCAQHEAVHLMLAPLNDLCGSRYLTEDEHKAAVESTVRRVQYALSRK